MGQQGSVQGLSRAEYGRSAGECARVSETVYKGSVGQRIGGNYDILQESGGQGAGAS